LCWVQMLVIYWVRVTLLCLWVGLGGFGKHLLLLGLRLTMGWNFVGEIQHVAIGKTNAVLVKDTLAILGQILTGVYPIALVMHTV
jgi:hypothetical protein